MLSLMRGRSVRYLKLGTPPLTFIVANVVKPQPISLRGSYNPYKNSYIKNGAIKPYYRILSK